MNIILGVTGSVAATLVPKIVGKLLKEGHKVKVIASKPSLYFFKEKDVETELLKDKHEWPSIRYKKDDPVIHINLRDWADMLIIAPLSANTLAKFANGLADNLLTCVFRAWDMEKPVVIAPAMNTMMWEHPATYEHIGKLKRWHKNRLAIVGPVEKMLACGEMGMGALADIDDIIKVVSRYK